MSQGGNTFSSRPCLATRIISFPDTKSQQLVYSVPPECHHTEVVLLPAAPKTSVTPARLPHVFLLGKTFRRLCLTWCYAAMAFLLRATGC